MEFDLSSLYENCVLFNGRFSALEEAARSLKESIANELRPVEVVVGNNSSSVPHAESRKRKTDARHWNYLWHINC